MLMADLSQPFAGEDVKCRGGESRDAGGKQNHIEHRSPRWFMNGGRWIAVSLNARAVDFQNHQRQQQNADRYANCVAHPNALHSLDEMKVGARRI